MVLFFNISLIMIKYVKKLTKVVFEEVPDEISLAINISNCQNRCEGCHTAELRANIGVELSENEIDSLIRENKGITCFLIMGEGNDRDALINVLKYVREKYNCLKTALYSGRESIEDDIEGLLDFVKIGPYMAEFGPLNSENTNQRFFKIEGGDKTDLTHLFWKTLS